jgi:hypothetical protein
MEVIAERKIMFRCGGGLGRIIAFAGVVKKYAEENPTHIIRVMSSYPDVFSNLHFIDRHYPIPQPGQIMSDFYESNKDFDVFEYEPYVNLDYRTGKKHILQVWCEKFGLTYTPNMSGTISLTPEEIQYAEMIRKQMNLGSSKLIAFQPFGGTPFTNPDMAVEPFRAKQARDIRVEPAQRIVDLLTKKGYSVLQVSLNSEPQLNSTLKLPVQQNQVLNPRILFAILNVCDGLLAIDSFAQHLWAALGKNNAVVMFGGTNPAALGYNSNCNLSNTGSCKYLFCNRPDSFLLDVSGDGKPWVCRMNKKCMEFIPENVVDKFDSLMKEKQNGAV